jgi:integrase
VGLEMASKKFSTQYTGVRYREYPSRKHNGKPDRYFFVRYKIGGKLKEEGVGWASQGWNAKKASLILADLKKAHLNGEGAQTLSEKRSLEEERRKAERIEQERVTRETQSFTEYFDSRYFPEAKGNKGWRSYDREDSLHRLWLKPVIGQMPLKDIRPFHLERVKKRMGDARKSPRSIQYALAVVRQVFNHAIRNEVFQGESPTRLVKKPKVDNKRIRFLTPDEAERLLQNLKPRSSQLYEMACLSLNCGLRAGEIFNLTWGCVDLTARAILLVDTKGGKNRTVYMTDTVHQILASKKPGLPTDLVYTDRKGSKVTEISNAFGRAVKELGFNNDIHDPRLKVIFHTLRHTYASWLVQNGVDLYTVKELLGHSTLAMTERYAHLANENLRNAANVLEGSLKNGIKSASANPTLPMKASGRDE